MDTEVTDYHDFVDIDTPKEKRRYLNVGDIYINAATCNLCGERIRSKNRHDYVTCKCGNVSVDGGSWYAKRGFKKNMKSFTNDIIYFSDVITGNVTCKLCHKTCNGKYAHLHRGEYICESCWDERLRITE